MQRVPLWPSNRWEQMDRGELILRNSGFKSRGRTSLPWHIQKVNIAPGIIKLEQECVEKFEKTIRPRMIHNARCSQLQLDDQALQMELLDRMAYADMILPEPSEVKAAQTAQAEQKAKADQEGHGARTAQAVQNATTLEIIRQ